MRTIIVDDDLLGIEVFEQECGQLLDMEILGKFDNGEEALAFAKENFVEFALLDVMLPGMDGIELGCELKKLYPQMIIIYLTGHSRYAIDAMRIKADYCIMKPYTSRDIRDAAMRVKLLAGRLEKKVKIVTFGKFEVFAANEPVYFSNSKARELFALCVDREGAAVFMEEAIDLLWPDRAYDEKVKRLYRKAVGAVQNSLEAVDAGEIFVTNRGSCHIVRDSVECDLYQFLEQGTLNPEERGILKTQGYMTDYSWAEIRNFRFSTLFGSMLS